MSTPAIIKLVFCFVIVLLTIISSLIPIKVKRITQSPAIMGLANSFAAGLFIAIALIHVQPESIAMYTAYMEKLEAEEESGDEHNDHDHRMLQEEEEGHNHSTLPLPQIMLFVGYTLILLVDRVLFDTHGMLDAEEHHRKEMVHSDSVQVGPPQVKDSKEEINEAEVDEKGNIPSNDFAIN